MSKSEVDAKRMIEEIAGVRLNSRGNEVGVLAFDAFVELLALVDGDPMKIHPIVTDFVSTLTDLVGAYSAGFALYSLAEEKNIPMDKVKTILEHMNIKPVSKRIIETTIREALKDDNIETDKEEVGVGGS